MMATKLVNNQIIIKPIQVKGLYPSKTKKDKRAYGYTGKLTQTHSDMILALVYFSPTEIKNPYEAPIHIAWMTRENIKPVKKGFNCPPAQIKSGKIVPRRDFRKFFDEDGLKRVERLSG